MLLPCQIKTFSSSVNSICGVLLVVFVLIVTGIMIKRFWSKQKIEQFEFLIQPYLKTGDQVMFKTISGMYVTACNNCEPYGDIDNKCSYVLCLRDQPYNTSIFTLHKHEDGRWSIETAYGKFFKRCQKCIPTCDGAICADGINSNLRTHKFHLIKSGNGTIRWKSDNGRFIESCPCDQTCGKLMCASGLGGDVDFQVEFIKTVPKPPRELKFKPQWQNQTVPDGVLLSNVQ